MQIQYFGLSSFKITTKDATIVTDPFHKDSGLVPPRGNADIVILSEKDKSLYSQVSGLSGEHFDIVDPGEYDTKHVAVTGIPSKQNGSYITVFLIEADDLRILNLTHIKEWNMSQDELEDLGEIDVLIVPVGGNTTLSAAQAAKLVSEVEPKLVIPSQYRVPGLVLDLDPVDKFIKEMGGKSEHVDKLTFKRRDLPEEGTRLVVLDPLR